MSTFTSPFLTTAKTQFIHDFYATSDGRDVDKYISFLTPDIKFTMGALAVEGEEAVRKIRSSMWSGVSTRLHIVHDVFSSDAEASELMLCGTVDYGLDNGGKVQIPWAGRMNFAKGEELKLSSYRVWLDTTPLVAALKA